MSDQISPRRSETAEIADRCDVAETSPDVPERQSVDDEGADPLTTLTNEQLGNELTALAARIAAATAQFLRTLGEFDARKGWEAEGIRSCAQWLSWRCGMSLGAAREHVRVARSLRSLPKTSAALAAGDISFSKARAITRIATDQTEPELLTVGRHGTAQQVETVVRGLRRADKGGVPPVAPVQRTYFRHRWDDDGTLYVQGRLSTVDGATFLAALNSVLDRLDDDRAAQERERAGSACVSTSDAGGTGHTGDTGDAAEAAGGDSIGDAAPQGDGVPARTPSQGRGEGEARDAAAARNGAVCDEAEHGDEADSQHDEDGDNEHDDGQAERGDDENGGGHATLLEAFVALAQTALDSDSRPGPSARHPDVVVHVDADVLTAPELTAARDVTTASGATASAGATAVGDATAAPAGTGATDATDATDATATDATAATGATAAPDAAADPLSVRCRIDGGPGLTARVARQLACDAGIVLHVHGPDGSSLAVGRRTRRPNAAIMRALWFRDGGCIHPACGRRRHLHAHHVVHWADGGPTDLSNLVLLCSGHHRDVHHGRIGVVWDDAGRPRVTGARDVIEAAPLLPRPDPDQPVDLEDLIPDLSEVARASGERLDLHYAVGAILDVWQVRAQQARASVGTAGAGVSPTPDGAPTPGGSPADAA